MFQWQRKLFPFSSTLFMVLITHRYTDIIFQSVYSNGDGNCSLLNALTINAFLLLLLLWFMFPNEITKGIGILRH